MIRCLTGAVCLALSAMGCVQSTVASGPSSTQGKPSRASSSLRFANIIFDAGDVLIDLRHEEFARLMTPIAGAMDNPAYRAIVHRFETGGLDRSGFRRALRDLRPENAALTDEAIDSVWASQEGAVDCTKVRLIEHLRNLGYRTYLLSTNNPIHAPIFASRLAECLPRGATNPLGALFTKVWFTHEVGLNKPDLAIYLHVLADGGLDSRETLFLDDNPANVVGAERAGIYSLLVTGPSWVTWLPMLLARQWK